MNSSIRPGAVRRALTLLSLPVFFPALPAQVSMKVETHSQLVAGKQTIPAKTPVASSGLSLRYSGGGSCQERASTLVTLGKVSVVLETTSSSFCSGAPVASGAILVTLQAARSTPVVLRGVGELSSGAASYRVDVGNDGTIDASDSSQFRGKREVEVPVVVGPAGLEIVIYSSSAVGSLVSSLCHSKFSLSYAPGTGTPRLQTFRSACGPELQVTFFQTRPFILQNNFHFEGRKLKPTYTWLVFGQTPKSLVLKQSGCVLSTSADIVFTMIPSARGHFQLRLSVPASLTGARALVQCVQASPLGGSMDWGTSQTYLMAL